MQNTETNTTETATEGDYIDTLKREIEALKQESARHQQAAREIAEARQQDDDRLAAALMAVIGDRVEALISDELETFRRDFDVSDYQSDIEYMLSDQIGEAIDDRLPEPETDDDRQEAVESIVRDILAGATVTIDI